MGDWGILAKDVERLFFNHSLNILVMGKADGFEELEAWKSAKELRRAVAKLTRSFPPHEKFSLTEQVTKSSRSVSANISEGYGRFHYKDSARHCRIARGSLTETLDHMIEANDEGYITEADLQEIRLRYQRCLKLINGYVKYLQSSSDKD